MIRVYVLPITQLFNEDVVAGIEYIHHAHAVYDYEKATVIMDTTPEEHDALSALALEVRDPTEAEIALVPPPPTEDELYQEQLRAEFNDVHELAVLALANWDSLNLSQKDTILKHLLKWVLWKEGWLHPEVP
ncbi:hypothetical protein ES703_102342 [subsurface metagenome]